MQSKHSGESYWHTPNNQPMKWATIPQFIDYWAEKSPHKEAYVVRMNGQPREAVTFSELKDKTEDIAAGLLKLGLAPGDFVMITGITCMNWILVDLACASIGVHTIRCRMSVLTKEGLHQIANSNKVKAIFYHPGEVGELHKHLIKCIPDAFQPKCDDPGDFCKTIPSLQYVISLSAVTPDDTKVTTVDDLTNTQHILADVKDIKANINPESILTVFITSGSTGFPKAIPYTHFSIVNIYLIYYHSGPFHLMEENDRFFSDRSLTWGAAFLYATPVFGCCTAYVHPLTNAKDNDVEFVIQVMQKEKVTCGLILKYLVADITERLRTHPTPLFFRWAMIGGEVIIPRDIEKLETLCGDIVVGYACTEAPCIASIVGTANVKKHIQFVGKVHCGQEIKIVDKNGKVVPLGCEGEIVIRSLVAFRGYLQQESTGMTVDEHGWIRTGDAGCLEDGGLLKVFGRMSDVISRGITLTYPAVVEKAIMQFPGVAAVAVVGVPDTRLGQNICACIIPQPGVELSSDDMLCCFDELYQTDEGLGMTPAYFLFLPQFPTVNGKADRKALVRMATEKFGIKMLLKPKTSDDAGDGE